MQTLFIIAHHHLVNFHVSILLKEFIIESASVSNSCFYSVQCRQSPQIKLLHFEMFCFEIHDPIQERSGHIIIETAV